MHHISGFRPDPTRFGGFRNFSPAHGALGGPGDLAIFGSLWGQKMVKNVLAQKRLWTVGDGTGATLAVFWEGNAGETQEGKGRGKGKDFTGRVPSSEIPPYAINE